MQATRTDCSVCGRSTYGPVNKVSPSGMKAHAPDCPVPRRCPRCGGRKHTGFDLCIRCERNERLERAVERERQFGIEDRERAVLGGGGQFTECVVCHQPGTDENPLGLYGINRATSHYGCVPFAEAM